MVSLLTTRAAPARTVLAHRLPPFFFSPHLPSKGRRARAHSPPRTVRFRGSPWIAGRLSEVTIDHPTRVVYRPHERPEFYLPNTGHGVHTAPAVLFTDHAYVNAA